MHVVFANGVSIRYLSVNLDSSCISSLYVNFCVVYPFLLYKLLMTFSVLSVHC
jgi:hypothetical protein